MIEFMGSFPSGTNQYKCSDCGTAFELRWNDGEGEPEDRYDDPSFCPQCGHPGAEIPVDVKPIDTSHPDYRGGICRRCKGPTTYTRQNSESGHCFKCEHEVLKHTVDEITSKFFKPQTS